MSLLITNTSTLMFKFSTHPSWYSSLYCFVLCHISQLRLTGKINSIIGFFSSACGDIFSGPNVLWYCSPLHRDSTNCSMLLLSPIKLINSRVSMCFLGHFYGAKDVSKIFNSIYVTIERRSFQDISITVILCHWDNWNPDSLLYIFLFLLFHGNVLLSPPLLKSLKNCPVSLRSFPVLISSIRSIMILALWQAIDVPEFCLV